MPSRKSKRRPSPRSPSKVAPGCSEREIGALARELAAELRPRDRVLLRGPLGSGKSTFARSVLESLGVRQPPEGSPSFAIAHEYDSPVGQVIHLDFYRIRSEREIDEAGIPAYFWERDAIVLAEWLSLWPEFEESVKASSPAAGGRVWDVTLDFVPGKDDLRRIEIRRP